MRFSYRWRRRRRIALRALLGLVISAAAFAYFAPQLATYVVRGALDASTVESLVADHVNTTRALRLTIGTLDYDPSIARIARAHSENMLVTGIFDHEIGGLGPSERAARAGYRCGLGENIIMAPRPFMSGEEQAAKALFESWMKSPGHRSNILTSAYRRTGVGVVEKRGTIYATQNFAAC